MPLVLLQDFHSSIDMTTLCKASLNFEKLLVSVVQLLCGSVDEIRNTYLSS